MIALDWKGRAVAIGAGLMGLAGCGVLGGMLWSTRGQLDDARETIQRQAGAIEARDATITTLRGNQTALRTSLERQGETIRRAAAEAVAQQIAAAAVIEEAQREAREAEVRVQAWKNIAKAGDRSQGADYAFDVRRAGAGR